MCQTSPGEIDTFYLWSLFWFHGQVLCVALCSSFGMTGPPNPLLLLAGLLCQACQ